MKEFYKIMRFIWHHPLASRNRSRAYSQFFSWQVRQKIRPKPERRTFVEDSILVVEKGMAGATGNIYTGLLEFEDMAFVLHILRPGDIFADVGANVGAYTILAAKNAGAKVVAVEPIPSTFEKLKRNVEANQVSGQVDLRCYGVGEKAETLRFTQTEDTVNHVLGSQEQTGDQRVVEVPVRTLDELLDGREPVLFKIDVEGFEWPALQGARRLLASPALKALIIELNGCGGRYGFDDDQIHRFLLSNGFTPYAYEPFGRQLKKIERYGNCNTIYIKDVAWINRRLSEAKRYRIMNIDV